MEDGRPGDGAPGQQHADFLAAPERDHVGIQHQAVVAQIASMDP